MFPLTPASAKQRVTAAPRQLCNESSELGRGYSLADWPWRDWTTVREQLVAYLRQPADFFRSMEVRRHFLWLMKWFSSGPLTSVFHAGCPLGVLSLRVFTVLVSNDADRCIQLRDARLGHELMDMPFADVVASGWPIFNMLGRLAEETRRVSFPLQNACDSLDNDTTFRQELVHTLLAEERLPALQAVRYLHGAHAQCAFGVAAAHFTLAAGLNSNVAAGSESTLRSGRQVAEDSLELLREGQRLLWEWPSLRRSLYELITTQWPVWRALERVALPIVQFPERRESPAVEAEVVFCGLGWPGLRDAISAFVTERSGWRLHFLMAEPGACPEFYRDVSQSLINSSRLVVLSPVLWAWNADIETAVVTAAKILGSDAEMHVVGFPTLDVANLWNMNAWQIRREPWKIAYMTYPTGYARTRGDRCFAVEATSATRVFRHAGDWRTVVSHVVGADADTTAGDLSWLVDNDLQTLSAGLRVYTCMTPVVRERTYLEEVTLTLALSEKYRMEVAHFSASNHIERCLVNSSDWVSLLPEQASDTGTFSCPPPPCLERDAKLALLSAVQWWSATGSQQPLAVRPIVRNAALLLTHGHRVLPLWRGRGQNPIPVTLLACFWAGASQLPQVPPELQVEAETPGEALYFKSVRSNTTVVEVRPCGAEETSLAAGPVAKGAVVRLSHAGPSAPASLSLRVLPAAMAPKASAEARQQPAQRVEALLCCMQASLEAEVRAFAYQRGWTLRSIVAEAVDCPDFLVRASWLLQDESIVVLLSPLLWSWDIGMGYALMDSVQGLAEEGDDTTVMGFPTLDQNHEWRWSLQWIRHQYWKLVYSLPRDDLGVVATGHGGEHQSPCAVGHAASGTRVFRRAATLKLLLEQGGPDKDLQTPYNWLVDLDMRALTVGLKVLACAGWPMLEADYLSSASLSEHLSTKYQIEVARFSETHFERCLPGSNWFQVAQKGLVSPWCFRRDVAKAFRDVHAWWTALDPERNFVVPEEGTFLSLFRNGATGIMPWDSDFDVKLYTEWPRFTTEEFINLTKLQDFQKLQIEAYAYDGCGQDSYVLLRRPNITHHIGDCYVSGGQFFAKHPWRARLFGGVEVRLSAEHLEHIFFTRYRTPTRKLFGDGIPLQCHHAGHNACLPDCRDEALPCEFEDHFVHLDIFSDDLSFLAEPP